jgi:hypothetical protein
MKNPVGVGREVVVNAGLSRNALRRGVNADKPMWRGRSDLVARLTRQDWPAAEKPADRIASSRKNDR